MKFQHRRNPLILRFPAWSAGERNDQYVLAGLRFQLRPLPGEKIELERDPRPSSGLADNVQHDAAWVPFRMGGERGKFRSDHRNGLFGRL